MKPTINDAKQKEANVKLTINDVKQKDANMKLIINDVKQKEANVKLTINDIKQKVANLKLQTERSKSLIEFMVQRIQLVSLDYSNNYDAIYSEVTCKQVSTAKDRA